MAAYLLICFCNTGALIARLLQAVVEVQRGAERSCGLASRAGSRQCRGSGSGQQRRRGLRPSVCGQEAAVGETRDAGSVCRKPSRVTSVYTGPLPQYQCGLHSRGRARYSQMGSGQHPPSPPEPPRLAFLFFLASWATGAGEPQEKRERTFHVSLRLPGFRPWLDNKPERGTTPGKDG